MQFIDLMVLIHVYLTGYPQTACIQFMASSVDGMSYTLLVCWRYFSEFRVGLRGCHFPRLCVDGMWYRPRSSHLPMRMDFLWHVINKSSSFYNVTPYLVKMDTLPSLAVSPTIIKDDGNSLNVSASATFSDIWGKHSLLTYLPLHALLLVTPTLLLETRNIDKPNFSLYFLLS